MVESAPAVTNRFEGAGGVGEVGDVGRYRLAPTLGLQDMPYTPSGCAMCFVDVQVEFANVMIEMEPSEDAQAR